MKELGLQKRIIDEFREVDGWGRKWATPMQNGMPDLILTLPDTGTFFVEVKLVERAKWPSEDHPIPIATTRLQRMEMARIVQSGGEALVMAGVIVGKEGRLYAANCTAELLYGVEPYTEWKTSKIELNAPWLARTYLRAI